MRDPAEGPIVGAGARSGFLEELWLARLPTTRLECEDGIHRGSAGIAKLLLESLVDSKPSDYVRSLSPDRFTEISWTWEEARRQAARVYETYHGV